ncbi:MAG TPA: hypothetical protein VF120_09970, partial [Ktedonobacterales bacterium]
DATLLDQSARRPDDPLLFEEAIGRVVEQLTTQRARRMEQRMDQRMERAPAPRPPLPAALQARLERLRERDRKQIQERIQAEQRAEALLGEFLTEEQRHQLANEGFVEVPSKLTPGRAYRVPRSGRFPLVYEHGIPVCRLCVGPIEPLPSADLVLCHLLLIRSDEQRYLATANRIAL